MKITTLSIGLGMVAIAYGIHLGQTRELPLVSDVVRKVLKDVDEWIKR